MVVFVADIGYQLSHQHLDFDVISVSMQHVQQHDYYMIELAVQLSHNSYDVIEQVLN